MTPDILDIAVVAIVLISGVLALSRDFVREVLSVVAWVGAAIATLYLFRFAQPVARTYITVELVAEIAAGVAIFVVALIALSLISHALSRRIRESALGPLDRSLGLVFGLVRGAAVVALAYMIFAALFLISLTGILIFLVLSLISHLILRRWHESALKQER